MKRPSFILCSLVFAIGMILLSGCNRLDGPSSTKPFRMEGPAGKLSLRASYFPSIEDAPRCFEVIAHTDGKRVDDSFWLFLVGLNDTKPGAELKPESVSFSASLSSDSRNYTGSYTGRMILTEKTKTRLIIRMEDVRFNILYGEYILNGDLVATILAEE